VAREFEERLRAGRTWLRRLKEALFEHYWNYFASARKKRAGTCCEFELRQRRAPERIGAARGGSDPGAKTSEEGVGAGLMSMDCGGGAQRRHRFGSTWGRAQIHGFSRTNGELKAVSPLRSVTAVHIVQISRRSEKLTAVGQKPLVELGIVVGLGP